MKTIVIQYAVNHTVNVYLFLLIKYFLDNYSVDVKIGMYLLIILSNKEHKTCTFNVR